MILLFYQNLYFLLLDFEHIFFFFFTGILPVCQNAEGLACVMGHEISHALAHHGAERAAHQSFVNKLGTGVAVSVGGMDVGMQRTAMQVFGAGAQFGGLLPFSRKHESEADRMGLTLMAAAGFDPREAPRFWERMAATSGKAGAEWMSTHPAHGTRIRDLNGWLPEAMEVYEAYQSRARDAGVTAESARRPVPGVDAAQEAMREFQRKLNEGNRGPAQPLQGGGQRQPGGGGRRGPGGGGQRGPLG